MPDNFSPTSANSLFEATTQGANLVASLRLAEGAYAKHGTGIAIRILVFDKAPRTDLPVTINRETAADLITAIGQAPPRLPISRPIPSPKTATPGIFRALKSPKTRPVIVRQPDKNDILPVEYTVLETPAALGEQHEGDGIGAAGDGEEYAARAAPAGEQGGRVEARGARGRRVVGRAACAQHPARFISRSAPRLAALAAGYLRPTSPSVAQACSLAPIACSAMPRRSIESGARLVSA